MLVAHSDASPHLRFELRENGGEGQGTGDPRPRWATRATSPPAVSGGVWLRRLRKLDLSASLASLNRAIRKTRAYLVCYTFGGNPAWAVTTAIAQISNTKDNEHVPISFSAN